jgi:hypothetical protein
VSSTIALFPKVHGYCNRPESAYCHRHERYYQMNHGAKIRKK